ncbi:MAG TPA: DUF6187 family protein [Mycobacteriales bacterium]|jgi:hypothetical protein|nr:DUF6187 family protein [Mycobacteriales bacterium]
MSRPAPEFLLPGVDDPAATETGVILLGLDPGRLLAGLGLTVLTGGDDPALVALAVDRARHGAGPVEFAVLLAAGARRWQAVRDTLPRDPVADASPRAGWDRTLRSLAACGPADAGPAELAFLAACRMRRRAVDDASAS